MSCRSKMLACFTLQLIIFAQAGAASAQPDVVIITIDTLRADRVGCYGYLKAKTPVLDALSREGVMFTNAVSHVPLTRPSHISIFTGLYPFEHNIHDNVAPALSKQIPTLAETFKNRGYATGGFVSSFVVNSQSGLERGFDRFADEFDPQKQPTQFALNLEKRGEEVYAEFAGWQATVKSQPYFAWVHIYDPHFPYEPPQRFLKEFSDRPYDGEIAYSDEIVGKILRLLRSDTLLIVTSDHGESLGDHNENAHSFFIYDSTLRVPMFMRWPGKLKPSLQVPFQTRLIDLFPTILDLLSIPIPAKVSGISLKPWLQQGLTKPPDLFSYCETFTPWLHFGWSRLQGIRSEKWKYIKAPRAELYDLHRDPAELKNLYTKEAMPVRNLKNWLQKSGALSEKVVVGSMQDLDPETLEKLASLGYAGVAKPVVSESKQLPDPKDKVEDFRLFNQLIREGIEAFQKQRFSEALTKFEMLRERNIPSFEVHYYLGKSYLRLQSYDKARTELDLAIQKLPHFLAAYKDLAEAWEKQGRLKDAESALLAGLTITPNHPLLVHPLAWLYQKQKKLDAAEKLLRNELQAHPGDTQSRHRLAAIYRDTGREAQAIEQLNSIIGTNPDDAEAHNQLGMIYGGTGRMREATRAFEKAVALSPQNEPYNRNLSLAKSKMLSKSEVVRFRIIQAHSKAVADVIFKKLQKGEAWDELASNYSVHPSSRFKQSVLELNSAEMEPAITLTLKNLKAGEYSPVIQTPQGYFLVKKEP